MGFLVDGLKRYYERLLSGKWEVFQSLLRTAVKREDGSGKWEVF
jgi:hypothetical protein